MVVKAHLQKPSVKTSLKESRKRRSPLDAVHLETQQAPHHGRLLGPQGRRPQYSDGPLGPRCSAVDERDLSQVQLINAQVQLIIAQDFHLPLKPSKT